MKVSSVGTNNAFRPVISHTAPAPPHTKYFGIQMLRGLAAVIVVLHHQAEAAGDIFIHTPDLSILNRGAFGTDIFFPISGFVMYLTATSILNRPRLAQAWKDFAWRRILRIGPVYWLLTLLKLFLLIAIPSAMLHYKFRLWNAIGAFLFIPSLNYMGQPEPPLVVGWTLAYEMFFYLLVTMAIAWRLPLLRWCAIVIGALSVLGLVIPHTWGLAYLADPLELEFLAGMLIAANATRLQALPAWVPALCLVGATSFVIAYPAVSLAFVPQRALLWGVPGALIVLAIVALESRLKLWHPRFLLLLGDASFSLYLTHTFVVPTTRLLTRRLHLGGDAGLAFFFLLGLLLCTITAILFHLYVELPMLNRFMGFRTPWSLHSGEREQPISK